MSRAAVAKDLVAAHARTLKMPGLARAYEALSRQAREECRRQPAFAEI